MPMDSKFRFVQPKPADMEKPTLVTIKISHYCEKARWALDYLSMDYREDAHLPVFHLGAARRNGGRSTPQLVGPGLRLLDSTSILLHLDGASGGRLFPAGGAEREAALRFELLMDKELGPHARRLVYWYLLADRGALLRVVSDGSRPGQERALGLLFPAIRWAMRKSMRVDRVGAERSRARLHAFFAGVDAMLSDGRRFLFDGRFTAAELGLASLAAPLLMPAGYLPWVDRASLPPGMRGLREEFGGYASARHALWAYESFRGAKAEGLDR